MYSLIVKPNCVLGIHMKKVMNLAETANPRALEMQVFKTEFSSKGLSVNLLLRSSLATK